MDGMENGTMDHKKLDVAREIAKTASAMGDALVEVGDYYAWESFYTIDSPDEGGRSQAASGRDQAWERCDAHAATLNELYREFCTVGGTHEEFLRICYVEAGESAYHHLLQMKPTWLRKDDLDKADEHSLSQGEEPAEPFWWQKES